MKNIAISLLIIFVNVCIIQSTKAETFENFDVSILYPLPEIQNWNDLLSPNSTANILPFEIFAQVPFLINQPNDKTYPDLRVIGIRIDPCFMEGQVPMRCQKQIRFIWQPLNNLNGVTSTVDATLHVFFELNSSEFASLIARLQSLRLKYSDEYGNLHNKPLGINPLIQKYGLQSEYTKTLNSIFLNAIEGKNLKRLTFMKLKGMNDFWIFGGLDKAQTGYEAIKIPRLEDNAIEQEFINQMAIRPNPTAFRGGIFPANNDFEFFNLIAKDSIEADVSRAEEMRLVMRSVANFEHPLRNNPGTLDCVTCHLANTMRAWLNFNFNDLNLNEHYEANRYFNASVNLINNSAMQAQTNNLRMFGYIGREPITAQRTINETAEVVRTIDSKPNLN